ncbi:hypothetical protein KKG81_07125 [bacterium]|nr:hypothetical protein [bacterium]
MNKLFYLKRSKPKVLKKSISVNSAILINSLVLQEAKDSLVIKNIIIPR